jgi:hypothetical protein
MAFGGKMTWQTMTEREKAAIMMESIKYRDEGNEAMAHELIARIPVPPYLAKIFKENFGADFLIKGGYNLSEAETAFGQGWLTR